MKGINMSTPLHKCVMTVECHDCEHQYKRESNPFPFDFEGDLELKGVCPNCENKQASLISIGIEPTDNC